MSTLEEKTPEKESVEDHMEEEEEEDRAAAGEQAEEKKKPASGKKSTAIVVSKEPSKKKAPAAKKTAPDADGEKKAKKRRPAAKKTDTPTEIVCPTRLHSIIHKIIEKKRPGLNIGSDFVESLSKALNRHVVTFIKLSHVLSDFKGLKTTNGNALIATGEFISELRRNPHLMLKIKPPTHLVLGKPVKKTELLLSY